MCAKSPGELMQDDVQLAELHRSALLLVAWENRKGTSVITTITTIMAIIIIITIIAIITISTIIASAASGPQGANALALHAGGGHCHGWFRLCLF